MYVGTVSSGTNEKPVLPYVASKRMTLKMYVRVCSLLW